MAAAAGEVTSRGGPSVRLQGVAGPGIFWGLFFRGDVRFGVQVKIDGVGRAFLLHGFPDQPEGQAGRIALPGEQARHPAGPGLGRLPAGARHLLLDQAPGGGDLLLGVEGVDRFADFLTVDTAAPELS